MVGLILSRDLFMEFTHNPGLSTDTFKTIRSIIKIPANVQNIQHGFSRPEDILGGVKCQVYDLMRDRVLTPRGYQSVSFHNYFSKADWSPVMVFRGSLVKPKCILATLTSNFQLVIYGVKDLRVVKDCGINNLAKWEVLLDLSTVYNRILLESWEVEDLFRFDEYRRRLYELAVVDFCWIPIWDETVNDDENPAYETALVTAQANGDICIWKISTTPTNAALTLELVFKTEAMKGSVISVINFFKINPDLGLLALATNSGMIKIFRVERRIPTPAAATDLVSTSQQYLYWLDIGMEVWEEDLIKVEFVEIVETMKESGVKSEYSGGTSIKLDLIAVKNPNVLVGCSITISLDEIIVHPPNYIKILNGPISGITHYFDNNFMICHERGITTLVSIKKGKVEVIANSSHSISVTNSSSNKKENPNILTYLFTGLAVSPNRALVCVGKQLGRFYDHLKLRVPGRVEFFTFLPKDITKSWDALKTLYIQNNNLLKRIPDALQAFRFQLQIQQICEFDQFEDDGSIWDMTDAQLRLYLWCLRALYLPENSVIESHEQAGDKNRLDSLVQKSVAVYRRRQEVQNLLVQRHVTALLKSITDNPDDPKYEMTTENIKSLTNIYQFLETIPNFSEHSYPSLPVRVKSLCPMCSQVMEYRGKSVEILGDVLPDVETDVDPNALPNSLWFELICEDEHELPICILSLVPCGFPYRYCSECNVTVAIEPAFGQPPICNLCGAFMCKTPTISDVEEEEEEETSHSEQYVNADDDVESDMFVPLVQLESPMDT